MSWLIGRTCTIGNDLSEAVLMADPFASHPSRIAWVSRTIPTTRSTAPASAPDAAFCGAVRRSVSHGNAVPPPPPSRHPHCWLPCLPGAPRAGAGWPGFVCGVVPPVPFPNTVVKDASADDTAEVTLWDRRSWPGYPPPTCHRTAAGGTPG